jgi:hypothetical protein
MKTRVVNVTVAVQQHTRWKKAAKQLNMPLSMFIRLHMDLICSPAWEIAVEKLMVKEHQRRSDAIWSKEAVQEAVLRLEKAMK